MPAEAERTGVLVTGAGGPAAVILLRAWAGRPDLRVVAGDIDPMAVGLYLVERGDRRLLRRGDDPAFVDHVLEICTAEDLRVVVPTVDSELLPLARRRAAFTAAGIELVAPGARTLELCLDKAALAARVAGVVPVPRTAVLDPAFDLAGWTLPVVTKPRSGSGSRDVSIVTTAAELARVPRSGAFLVQEHLPGPEYSIDVLAGPDGRVIASVPRSRLKVDSGISVAGRTHRDPELEELGRATARAIGLVGVANVQVKGAVDGRPALLEVNPRFPGAMVLTVAAGVDMPELVMDAALGRPLPAGPLRYREIGMVRFWEDRVVPVEELGALEAPTVAIGRSG